LPFRPIAAGRNTPEPERPLIPSIPLRTDLEIFRDPDCKKLKPSLRILMYCKTSSSYRTDNPCPGRTRNSPSANSKPTPWKQEDWSLNPGTSGQVHLTRRGPILISASQRERQECPRRSNAPSGTIERGRRRTPCWRRLNDATGLRSPRVRELFCAMG